MWSPKVRDRVRPGTVAVAGLPWDKSSSFLPGAALGPERVREVLNSGASNLCSESGLDLAGRDDFLQLGELDLDTGNAEDALGRIEAAINELLERGAAMLSIGGDHSVTVPILRALGPRNPGLTILHLDAHPDLYDSFDGDRLSHACPFARIMEEGLAQRLVQLGIRTMNPHQRQQAERFGVEVVEMRDWRPERELDLAAPLYVSIDLDALDPAFAPGVSHHEPGGFTSRDVVDLIQRLPVPPVGADIVELNPTRDEGDRTAALAAKLLKELAAQMLKNR